MMEKDYREEAYNEGTKKQIKGIKKEVQLTELFFFLGYSVLALFTIAIVIPLAYVVIASFMDPNVLNNQGISFRMSDWSLEAYRRVLEDKMIWRGFCKFFLLLHYSNSNLCFHYTSCGLSNV